MERIHLFDSYYFCEADGQEINTFYNEHVEKVFTRDIYIDVHLWLSDEEIKQQTGLWKRIENRYRLSILIYKEAEIIGWHFGWQIDEEQYYMCNTGLLEAHQGKGIYSKLLPGLMEIFREKGFQKIISTHHAANNAILIPKLKAGFVVTGIDINEQFGLRVILTYLFNNQRLGAHKFRMGDLRYPLFSTSEHR